MCGVKLACVSLERGINSQIDYLMRNENDIEQTRKIIRYQEENAIQKTKASLKMPIILWSNKR